MGIHEHESGAKKHENFMAKNWRFHGNSMAEAVEFLEFYSESPSFAMLYARLFPGLFMQISCAIMDLSWFVLSPYFSQKDGLFMPIFMGVP